MLFAFPDGVLIFQMRKHGKDWRLGSHLRLRIQLPPLSGGIAARKLPPASVPLARDVDHGPPHRRGHRRPVAPPPVFVRPVHVEQEEDEHVGHARLHKRLLAPFLEPGHGSALLGRAGRRTPRVRCKAGDARDLIVEVALQRPVQGVEDGKGSLRGKGKRRRGDAREVRFHVPQRTQDGFCKANLWEFHAGEWWPGVVPAYRVPRAYRQTPFPGGAPLPWQTCPSLRALCVSVGILPMSGSSR